MKKNIENRRATSNNPHGISNAHNSGVQGSHGQIYVPPGQQSMDSSGNGRQGNSPAHSFSNIQKISARLRARNPVIMSMNTSPQMLLPLSQRSLSPSSYQQLQTTGQQDVNNSGGLSNQMTSQQIQVNANMGSGQAQPNSREFQRKILHKSLNNSGVHQQKQNAHMSMDGQIGGMMDQGRRDAGKSSGPDNRANHQNLNMSSHMITNRQQDSLHVGMADRGPLSGSIDGNPTSVHLNKKFSGHHRKRNAREKSYDLYNQKLQLPPMMKPGGSQEPGHNNQTMNVGSTRANGKQERTYSLPSAGNVHQSLPLSPNMAMQSIGSPKGLNPIPQRQSINDALKSQVSPTGQQASAHGNRYPYNNGMSHVGNAGNKMHTTHSTSNTPQNGANLSNMKGFFSARGQGIRNQQHNPSEITKPSVTGNRGMSNSNAGSLNNGQGVFSPRRNIISNQGQNNQFVGARQNNSNHQRQSSSKNKTVAHSQSADQSSSNMDDIRMRQSVTLSPRPQINTTSPQPMAHQASHESRVQSAESSETLGGASTSAETTKNSKTQGGNNNSSDDNENRANSQMSGNSNQENNIQFVEVQTLLFGENPPVLNPKTLFLKNHEPTKASQKKCGLIKSYAANTNQGIIRDYNEDRVSIILNILKPTAKKHLNIEWPQICFFGVFDGHGGAACADYLRDNLHNFVVQNDNFPQYPQEAIMAGFRECERNFLSLVEAAQSRAQAQMPGQQVGPERSGSCASVVMIIDDMAYVVNVGDSRCLMSLDAGAQIAVLTRDHKPDDEQERVRIQAAGGKIYRTQTLAKAATTMDEKDLYVQGPLRVFPGRLSVSRTFGDIEAKKPKYGGNMQVIVCEPEIKSFKLKNNFDFFLIGCDGIFERLDNKQTMEAVWDRIAEQTTSKTYDNLSPQNVAMRGQQRKLGGSRAAQFHYDEHIAAAEGVEIVLREAAASRSLDNITVLILGLKNLKTSIKKLNEGQTIQQVRQQNMLEQRGVKHTYDKDFEYLEVNETDLNLLSDNEVNSAGSQEADATCTIEAEGKKTNPKSISSPTTTTSKAPSSRQKNAPSNTSGPNPRKF